MFWHGCRVSEVLELRGTDVTADGCLIVKRMKGSLTTVQPLRADDDPLFDERPLIEMAREYKGRRLFEVTRRRIDQVIKEYGAEAGIPAHKLHAHAMKHSIAMALWGKTQDLGQIQRYLGHKAASSTLAYLYEHDVTKAFGAVAGIQI
jgi:integrase